MTLLTDAYVYAITKFDPSSSQARTQDEFVKEVYRQLENYSDHFRNMNINFTRTENESIFNLSDSAQSTREIGDESDYKRTRIYGIYGSGALKLDEEALNYPRSKTSGYEPIFLVVRGKFQGSAVQTYKEIDYTSEVRRKVEELISELRGK